MKVLAFLLIATLTLTLSDREILQTGLNGLYEANSLPDPTTVVECLNDEYAHKTVEFATQLFSTAATGSAIDIAQLIPKI